MTPQETTDALAIIQVYDNRTVDELTIKSWHQLLWRYTSEDVQAAIHDFFATETDYLKPAHIIRRVRQRRARRLETFGGVHLNFHDEFNDDGSRHVQADAMHNHMLELVKSGALQPSDYLAYKREQVSLQELFATVHQPTHNELES